MVKDDYEIVPYEEIEEIKRQIEDLQRKSLDTLSSDIVKAMKGLTEAVENMLHFFQKAAEEMNAEDKGPKDVVKKLDEVIEQNKTVAEGIVAVADMIKEMQTPEPMKTFRVPPRQSVSPPPMHLFNSPRPNALPQRPPPMPNEPPPRPEPEKHKKKGLFGRFR